MNQKLHTFIFTSRFSGLITFFSVASILTLMFLASGVFDASRLPREFNTRIELIGQISMLIIMPAYLLMGLIFGQRRSLRLALELEIAGGYQFADQIESIPGKYLLVGAILGFAYSLLNLPDINFKALPEIELSLAAIVFGQNVIWITAGVTLSARYHVARSFYSAGKQVRLDIFETSNLKPFGQAGLTDALLVVVALAITTLQSIDAQFRLYNYITAFAVILPAMAVLMVTPMYSLHRRIVDLKVAEMKEINAVIRSSSKDLDLEQINHLEPLLQRRERLEAIHTWPLDMSVISRLLLYFIVPPLAWLGAAFVEIVLDSLITAS